MEPTQLHRPLTEEQAFVLQELWMQLPGKLHGLRDLDRIADLTEREARREIVDCLEQLAFEQRRAA